MEVIAVTGTLRSEGLLVGAQERKRTHQDSQGTLWLHWAQRKKKGPFFEPSQSVQEPLKLRWGLHKPFSDKLTLTDTGVRARVCVFAHAYR